jgi:oligopeptide transport system ATP-binding protein
VSGPESPLLAYRGVTIRYGARPVVRQVSLELGEGETLGVAGESGSGKTTLGRAALRLVPLAAGAITLLGRPISGSIPREEIRALPQRVQMIFQDPMASLNERARVEYIVTEGLRSLPHPPCREKRRALARQALEAVGLSAAMLDRYPHQFSGGQRQRIGIARALVMEPRVILADEPVSALDVSARAQVINLLAEMKARRGLSYLFISHDLMLMEYFCDRIAVLYQGRLVELAASDELFRHPLHPYTRMLLDAVPVPDPGSVPKPLGPKPPPPGEGGAWVQRRPGHFVLENDT